MRIRVDNVNKLPVCPECGQTLKVKDALLDDHNGDSWVEAYPCDNPECRLEQERERLNPKFYYAGGRP